MKLIILDRDGVINHDSDDYIKSADEWHPISGSLEAIARLYLSGYRIIVISNQSGLARGTFNIEALNSIHDKMHRLLAGYGGVIEAIFFCPHSPDDGCGCRKPRPGLYLEVAKRLRIKLNNVSAVGDKLSDIQAATAGGAKPVLVRTGYGKLVEDGGTVPDGVPIFDDLAAVVDRLLQH